jgi:hypothetical protein
MITQHRSRISVRKATALNRHRAEAAAGPSGEATTVRPKDGKQERNPTMNLTSGQIVPLLARERRERVAAYVNDPGDKPDADDVLRAVHALGPDGRHLLAAMTRDARKDSTLKTRGVRIQGSLIREAMRAVWIDEHKAVAWFYLARASVDQRLEAWVASNAFTATPTALRLTKFQLKVANAAAEQNWGGLTILLRRARTRTGWDRERRTYAVYTHGDVDCVVHSDISNIAGDFTSGITKVQLRFAGRPVNLDPSAGVVLVRRLES